MATIIETVDSGFGFGGFVPYDIEVGDTFEGNVTMGGDIDFLYIDLVAGQTYTLSVDGLAGGISEGVWALAASEENGIFLDFPENSLRGGITPILTETDTGWVATFDATITARYTFILQASADGAPIEYSVSVVEGAPSAPTDGNDNLVGDDTAENIALLEGDDRLDARGGNDTVRAGDGEDIVVGGDGNDRLFGDNGDDTLRGGSGDDVIQGNKDDDFLRGNGGNDRVLGGEGNDIVLGDSGNDTVMGNKGDDDLQGGAGDDLVVDAQGNSTIDGGTGNDRLKGGADDDTFVFNAGFGTDTVLDFGNGDDLLDLTGLSLSGLGDLTMTQVGNTLEIATAAGDTIVLNGQSLGGFDTGDILL